MELVQRNAYNSADVKIGISELVLVKGVVFKVSGISLSTREVKLQPGNADHIKEWLNKNTIHSPKLSEPNDRAEMKHSSPGADPVKGNLKSPVSGKKINEGD
jgi:hypothetical protein